jgi:uncharacterized repeat protein (TIGR03806 family)
MRLALAALTFVACGGEPEGPTTISEWGLFADPAMQIPAEGVVPYEINAPLFSDYAAKHRFIRLPEGTTIALDADGRMLFPDGTVLVKTFGFLRDLRDPSLGERIVETRLLVLEGDTWEPYVYVWNDDVSEATLDQTGARVPVEFTGNDGSAVPFTYRVPNEVQCGNCHGGTGASEPIGPRASQLDRMNDYGAGEVNQLDHLVSLGWLASRPSAPAWVDPDDTSAPLEERARAYLHANCAHCHREGGASSQSGLWYDYDVTEDVRLGVCKPPAAAGRGTGGRPVDLWPGDPERSIMVFRMESTEAGVKMPELPTVLAHTEGAALIREWVAAMPPRDCSM